MNCTVRSSRVTGPKIRVPIGSSLLVNSTAALPSNLDQRAVRATHAKACAHDHRVIDLALLDLTARNRILDADLDDIPDGRRNGGV